MTLLAALRSQQDMDVVNVNFSSSTTPELLMQVYGRGYGRSVDNVEEESTVAIAV